MSRWFLNVTFFLFVYFGRFCWGSEQLARDMLLTDNDGFSSERAGDSKGIPRQVSWCLCKKPQCGQNAAGEALS